MTKRFAGFLGALAAAIAIFAGCSEKKATENAEVPAGKLFPIRVQLNWFPEPEHGGLFQALAKGYFAEEGLDVTLLPGGSNVLVTQFVATGQAEIGQSSTSQIILAVAGGLPVINIGSIFHRTPSGLLMHQENPIASFPELNGKTIMGRPEAVYIPYLKKKYNIDFKVIPQNFGSTQFLQDPNFIQEGFFIAEPYFLEEKGAKVKWLALWDAGYEPADTLFTTTEFARAHPAQLKAFMRAFVRGWKEYLEGDPSAGDALIKKDNPKIGEAFAKFERDQILKYNLGRGDPAQGEDYGTLSPDKVKREIAIMEEAAVIKPGAVAPAQIVTQEFLPVPAPAK